MFRFAYLLYPLPCILYPILLPSFVSYFLLFIVKLFWRTEENKMQQKPKYSGHYRATATKEEW